MNWWKSPRTFPIKIFLEAFILRLIPVVPTRSKGNGPDEESILCLPLIFLLSSGTFGQVFSCWRYETLLMGLFLIGYITPHLLILYKERFHFALVPFFAILIANLGRLSAAERALATCFRQNFYSSDNFGSAVIFNKLGVGAMVRCG